MNLHTLKTDPAVFQAVWDDKKTYEIRKNDRDYQVGDVVVLRELVNTGDDMQFCGKPLAYTGRTISNTISHVLKDQYGVARGWAILSLTPGGAVRSLVNAGGTEVAFTIPKDTSEDALAVDRFSEAMKGKLAQCRIRGYGGWDDETQCPKKRLLEMLCREFGKGDPVDLANYAMMLHQRDVTVEEIQEAVGEWLANLYVGYTIIAKG